MITWSFDASDIIGTAVLVQRIDGVTRKFDLDIRKGNAYAVFTRKDNPGQLIKFWLDKQHMLNDLGLNKKGGYTENRLDNGYQTIEKITLTAQGRCIYVHDIAAAFARAFDNITICIS